MRTALRQRLSIAINRNLVMRILLLLILTIQMLAFAEESKGPPESAYDETQQFIVDKYLLILGSHVHFHRAYSQAVAVSRRSRIPFSMQGLVYDKKRGLILPDDSSDTVYAGSYLHRREHTAALTASGEPSEYISIERSDAYAGFTPGLYIIVGGILGGAEQARKALAQFKTAAPGAYLKKTKIYMGCLH